MEYPPAFSNAPLRTPDRLLKSEFKTPEESGVLILGPKVKAPW
jgi:hypothetical protein